MAKNRYDTLLGVDDAAIKAKPWKHAVPPSWWHEENTTTGDGAPNIHQQEYIDDSTSEVIIYGGSYGGGKTQGSIWKLTKYAWQYPGIGMVAGRLHFSHVIPMVFEPAVLYWERLKKRYGWGFEIKKTNSVMKVTFCTGSTLSFMGFDDPDSFQGLTIRIAYWDEIGQGSEASLRQLHARLRGELMGAGTFGHYPRQLLGTSNYATGYVNEQIVGPARRGELSTAYPGARFIPCSTYDLSAKYDREAKESGQRSYIDTMIESKLITKEELVDGWIAPEGTVWRPLNETGDDRDILSMFEFVRDFGPILDTDTVYFGLDHGINHPSTVVAGVFRKSKATGKDVFIVFAEWSEPLDDRPHSYLASVIARLIMPAREHFGWVDSRMKHGQNQIGNGTMAPIFQIMAAGISCMPAPCCKPNQKALSIHAVAEAVANHAVLFVREGTEKLRRQWVGYMKAGASAKPGADPCLPAPDSTNDHLLDAFRYCISGLVASDRISVSTRVVLGLAEKEPGAKTSMEMLEERATDALAAQQHRAPVDMRAARQYELSGRMPEPQSVGMPFVGDSLRRDW